MKRPLEGGASQLHGDECLDESAHWHHIVISISESQSFVENFLNECGAWHVYYRRKRFTSTSANSTSTAVVTATTTTTTTATFAAAATLTKTPTTMPTTTVTEKSPPHSPSPTFISHLGSSPLLVVTIVLGINLCFAILVIICLFVTLLRRLRSRFYEDGVRNPPSSDIHDVKVL
ncbi:hypothetical protein EGR_10695 [Echinococcus granulosus]|uniref:Uncharacterized protein n=1 Tax=Echinococcus granulosus TaxID=6210 RepID=W6U0C3_ECHGR|nr:hypothetical protein EGR_10695 [Echinococcus granulosus]EUB54443.1 hypothetical protein EGR_10695 [Echinococcus granulosus]